MRRRSKKHVIYTYRKHKFKRKNWVIFFGGLLVISYFLFSSYNSASYPLPTTNSIGVLAVKVKKITSFPTGFTLDIGVPPAAEITPTVTPQPKAPLLIPVARAQIIPEDFCLNVPVLLYHHIQPLAEAAQLGHSQLTVDSNYFDEQMAYLAASGYHSLSADELTDALIHHRVLPDKSILVTFDDGYDDNYTYAFQILKKHNIAGNFMIATGLIENKGYMTWDNLKEMAGNPLMHIYNHTWSHVSLDGAGKDKIEFEIATANKQLEENLGKNVGIFTYPYGSFNQLVIGVLREHGFRSAFSTINGTTQCESYIFALRRTHIGNAPLASYGF